VKRNALLAYAQIAEKHVPGTSNALDPVDVTIRFARLGLYLNQSEQTTEALVRRGGGAVDLATVLRTVCFNPFDHNWFLSLDPELIVMVFEIELRDAVLGLKPNPGLFELLKSVLVSGGQLAQSAPLIALLCEQYLLQGRIQEARAQIARLTTLDRYAGHVYRGWLAFLEGENSLAIAEYDRAIKGVLAGQKTVKNKHISYFVPGFTGLFFTFALIRDGSPDCLRRALGQTQLGGFSQTFFSEGYKCLSLAIATQLGNLNARKQLLTRPLFNYRADTSIDALLSLMARYWLDQQTVAELGVSFLRPLYRDGLEAGYDWIALKAASLLAELHEDKLFARLAETMREMGELPKMVLFSQVMQPKSEWELQLMALQALKASPLKPDKPEKIQRMAWTIQLISDQEVTIEPREQTQNAKGEWSRGRAVSLKRLFKELDSFRYLSDRDHQVCEQIEAYRDYSSDYGGSTTYSLPSQAILNLVGHPAVVWRDTPTVGVEIVAGQPQLVVRHNDDGTLVVALVPAFRSNQERVIEREAMTRLKVVTITEKHRKVATIFGGSSEIRVPAYAQNQVLAAIEAVAGNMLVQSDIGGVSNIASVPSDSTPHLHLLSASPGLKVLLLARPFRSGGPYYRPGYGGTTAIAEIEGLQVQTTRYRRRWHRRKPRSSPVRRCNGWPDIARRINEWRLEEPINCLELLAELQALQPPELDEVVAIAPEAELPSRTEITLPVELSRDELELYDATRRNALQKLSEADNQPPGARHLRVLAEILRLRRLCCNPSLVVPDTSIGSSKLAVFGELLEELLENRHKALVFSQFVDHLTIVRNYLDGQQRPVTIYRLVSCGTIEEKIVDLHQQKQDLADSLLEGTDVSGKLSADQLLAMISS